MEKTIAERIETRLKDFENYVLDVEEDEADVKVYRVHRPGYGSIDSFLLVYVADGLCLLGDYAPGHNGAISSRGYSVDWFARPLSSRYLAEKFLERGWHEENARWWLENLIKELEEEGGSAEAVAALRDLPDDSDFFNDPYRFQDAVSEILPNHEWCGSSPHDYCQRDLVALAVCQRVFSRLYRALRESGAAAEAAAGGFTAPDKEDHAVP